MIFFQVYKLSYKLCAVSFFPDVWNHCFSPLEWYTRPLLHLHLTEPFQSVSPVISSCSTMTGLWCKGNSFTSRGGFIHSALVKIRPCTFFSPQTLEVSGYKEEKWTFTHLFGKACLLFQFPKQVMFQMCQTHSLVLSQNITFNGDLN